MNKQRLLSTAAIMLFVALMGISCNQSQKKSENSESNLPGLKSQLNQLAAQIDSLETSDSIAFIAAAETIIEDFYTKMEEFGMQVKESGEAIDESTLTAIEKLVHKAKKIDAKLDTLGAAAYGEMQDAKQEIQHDLNELGESFTNFFKDNA